MNKIRVILITILLTLIPSLIFGHEEMSLNGKWEYIITGEKVPPFQVTSGWEEVLVPSFIRIPADRTAWYRQTFSLPESFKDKVIKLRFEAVKVKTTVYLNGIYIGEYLGGFEPFDFDITKQVRLDKENELYVGVRGWSELLYEETGRKIQLGGPSAGINFSGIWGDVSLLAYNEVGIEDTFVITSLRKK